MAQFKSLSGGLFICLMLAPALLAQSATRYERPSLTTTPAQVPVGSLPQLLAVTNATISICGFPATMANGVCTNTITTSPASTEVTTCPSTAQLTPSGDELHFDYRPSGRLSVSGMTREPIRTLPGP